jgi:hypothetical protein
MIILKNITIDKIPKIKTYITIENDKSYDIKIIPTIKNNEIQ